MPLVQPPATSGITGVVVQEADGSPSGTATVLVLPNTTLAVSGGTATYTPTASGSGVVVQEVDGNPSGTATSFVFSNSSLTFSNGTATVVTGAGTVTAPDLVSGKNIHTEGSDYTTTSTSFVDVDATDLVITMTTGARRVLIGASADTQLSASGHVCLDVTVDGTRLGNTNGLIETRHTQSGELRPVTLIALTDVLSAASHTFKLQWRVTTGTGTINSTSSVVPVVFYAVELYTS